MCTQLDFSGRPLALTLSSCSCRAVTARLHSYLSPVALCSRSQRQGPDGLLIQPMGRHTQEVSDACSFLCKPVSPVLSGPLNLPDTRTTALGRHRQETWDRHSLLGPPRPPLQAPDTGHACPMEVL